MLTQSSITLHRAEPDFAQMDDLLALILRSFAYMDGAIDPPSSAHRLTVENLREKCAVETAIVAMDSNELLGCIFLAEKPDHVYLGKFAVDPDSQGKGIGKALMHAAETFAVNADKPVLELQTRIELTGNHAAFARLGFIETAQTVHAGYNHPTSITMRKSLM